MEAHTLDLRDYLERAALGAMFIESRAEAFDLTHVQPVEYIVRPRCAPRGISLDLLKTECEQAMRRVLRSANATMWTWM